MTVVQSLRMPTRCGRSTASWLWIVALAASVSPWLVVAVKLLLVAGKAPLALVEATISAIFISIPVSACIWLGSTVLALIIDGWRRGLFASIGLLPLALIYFITIFWLNR